MNLTSQPIDAEADIDAYLSDIDALDKELDDARLPGREQLVPQRIQPFQGFPDLSLGQTINLGPCRSPCATITSGARRRPRSWSTTVPSISAAGTGPTGQASAPRFRTD